MKVVHGVAFPSRARLRAVVSLRVFHTSIVLLNGEFLSEGHSSDCPAIAAKVGTIPFSISVLLNGAVPSLWASIWRLGLSSILLLATAWRPAGCALQDCVLRLGLGMRPLVGPGKQRASVI